MAEGIQVFKEALFSSVPIEAIFFTESGERELLGFADVIEQRCQQVFRVSDEVIMYLTDTVNPQGILMVLPFLHQEDLSAVEERGGPLVFLDQVRDPGNMGTLMRVADAAGVKALLVSERSADIYNPKVVRASAGSLVHLPLFIEMDLKTVADRLRKKGYTIVATATQGDLTFWDYEWSSNTMVIMGNEAWGIPEEDLELADVKVSIPIFGRAESLNVAAAAALILYEIRRKNPV